MTPELMRIALAKELGWRLWPIIGFTPPGTTPPFTLGSYPPLPNYPEDANAALEVVSMMRGRGWNWNAFSKHDGTYFSFHNVEGDIVSSANHFAATAETMPLAICEAACLALNIHVE